MQAKPANCCPTHACLVLVQCIEASLATGSNTMFMGTGCSMFRDSFTRLAESWIAIRLDTVLAKMLTVLVLIEITSLQQLLTLSLRLLRFSPSSSIPSSVLFNRPGELRSRSS